VKSVTAADQPQHPHIARTPAVLTAPSHNKGAQVNWLNRVREDLESYRSALGWVIERNRTIEVSIIVRARHARRTTRQRRSSARRRAGKSHSRS
jgi:hypothetical protein